MDSSTSQETGSNLGSRTSHKSTKRSSSMLLEELVVWRRTSWLAVLLCDLQFLRQRINCFRDFLSLRFKCLCSLISCCISGKSLSHHPLFPKTSFPWRSNRCRMLELLTVTFSKWFPMLTRKCTIFRLFQNMGWSKTRGSLGRSKRQFEIILRIKLACPLKSFCTLISRWRFLIMLICWWYGLHFPNGCPPSDKT